MICNQPLNQLRDRTLRAVLFIDSRRDHGDSHVSGRSGAVKCALSVPNNSFLARDEYTVHRATIAAFQAETPARSEKMSKILGVCMQMRSIANATLRTKWRRRRSTYPTLRLEEPAVVALKKSGS